MSARDERGQATMLIIGLLGVLLTATAMVVDASAAYLQRQSLDTLADGAALAAADAGALGEEVYTDGVGEQTLAQVAEAAHHGAADFFRRSGAHARFPGLSFAVEVDETSGQVTVRVQAPLDLPLAVPGSPDRPMIGASGSAVVAPQR